MGRKTTANRSRWEKAARCGLEDKTYAWGDAIDESQANYGTEGTKLVGSYAPNNYGLYDVIGNVWEWCVDEFNSLFYAKSEKQPCGR